MVTVLKRLNLHKTRCLWSEYEISTTITIQNHCVNCCIRWLETIMYWRKIWMQNVDSLCYPDYLSLTRKNGLWLRWELSILRVDLHRAPAILISLFTESEQWTTTRSLEKINFSLVELVRPIFCLYNTIKMQNPFKVCVRALITCRGL